MKPENNFGEDVQFLKQHVQTIVLSTDTGARVAVVPQYQGRTMTSTTDGERGRSHGWINYEQISTESPSPQVNLYGGEDRFWLSPEGGQYSFFFDPGVSLDLAHWRTPSPIDTDAFGLVQQDALSVAFRHRATLTNYSGYNFDMQFDRTVSLLSTEEIVKHLDVDVGGLRAVGHESRNRLTNVGVKGWVPETGLPGIWILCMNKPSAGATVVVPFKKGDPEKLGAIVNADYFGRLDKSRLSIDEQTGLIYFLGDGKLRSKLGLTFDRVCPWLGSWDGHREVLTIAQFNLPASAPNGYTNNLWEIQSDPYCGDVINSYNDGPNESGGMLGPFFELETLSPALALDSGESYTHVHRTIRLEGERAALSSLAESVFGVDLGIIENQFGTARSN